MLHYLHPFLWTQPALKKICSAVRRTKWRSRQWFRSWCRHENMGKNTLETWWFLGLMVASLLLLVHPWKMPFQISHLGRPFERARHSRGGTKCSTATLTFLLVVNIQFLSQIHFIMCHLRWLRLIWFWSWLWTPKIRWWNRTCSLETPGWDYPNDLTQLQISSRHCLRGRAWGPKLWFLDFLGSPEKGSLSGWLVFEVIYISKQTVCGWQWSILPLMLTMIDDMTVVCRSKTRSLLASGPQNKVRWALQSSHWGPAPIDPFWRLNLAQDEHQNLSHVKPTITILNTDTNMMNLIPNHHQRRGSCGARFFGFQLRSCHFCASVNPTTLQRLPGKPQPIVPRRGCPALVWSKSGECGIPPPWKPSHENDDWGVIVNIIPNTSKYGIPITSNLYWGWFIMGFTTLVIT